MWFRRRDKISNESFDIHTGQYMYIYIFPECLSNGGSSPPKTSLKFLEVHLGLTVFCFVFDILKSKLNQTQPKWGEMKDGEEFYIYVHLERLWWVLKKVHG